MKSEDEYTNVDWKKERINAQAMQDLTYGLTLEQIRRVYSCRRAQEIWRFLETTNEGTSQMKKTNINFLQHEFELFSIKKDEAILNPLVRFMGITNVLKALGKKVEENNKANNVIRSLPMSWDSQVTEIKETKDLKTLGYNALIESLQTMR